jgi:hypothetical protein
LGPEVQHCPTAQSASTEHGSPTSAWPLQTPTSQLPDLQSVAIWQDEPFGRPPGGLHAPFAHAPDRHCAAPLHEARPAARTSQA